MSSVKVGTSSNSSGVTPQSSTPSSSEPVATKQSSTTSDAPTERETKSSQQLANTKKEEFGFSMISSTLNSAFDAAKKFGEKVREEAEKQNSQEPSNQSPVEGTKVIDYKGSQVVTGEGYGLGSVLVTTGRGSGGKGPVVYDDPEFKGTPGNDEMVKIQQEMEQEEAAARAAQQSLKRDMQKLTQMSSPGFFYEVYPLKSQLKPYMRDQSAGIRDDYLKLAAQSNQSMSLAVSHVNSEIYKNIKDVVLTQLQLAGSLIGKAAVKVAERAMVAEGVEVASQKIGSSALSSVQKIPQLSDAALVQRTKDIHRNLAIAELEARDVKVTEATIEWTFKKSTVSIVETEVKGQTYRIVTTNRPQFQKLLDQRPEKFLQDGELLGSRVTRVYGPEGRQQQFIHAEQLGVNDAALMGGTEGRVASSNPGCTDLCGSLIDEFFRGFRHVNPKQ